MNYRQFNVASTYAKLLGWKYAWQLQEFIKSWLDKEDLEYAIQKLADGFWESVGAR